MMRREVNQIEPEPEDDCGGDCWGCDLVIVFVLGRLGVDIPADVAAAVTTIIAFVAAYVKSSNDWQPR